MTRTSYSYYYPVMKDRILFLPAVLLFFLNAAVLSAQIDKSMLDGSRLLAINKYLVLEESRQLLELNATVIDMASYVMTPGDVYILTIASGIDFDSNKLSKLDYPMILSSDHMLNVPVINEINVEGKTIKEVERMIDARLQQKGVLYQFLTLQLKIPSQFDVVVHGEVNLPGIKPCNPELTLTDVLTLSGGLTANASYRRIALIRKDTTKYYDISAFFFKGDLNQNPRVQPGDRIFVGPAATNVFIFGNIKHTGIFELVDGENYSSLIDIAGNYNDNSGADYIEVTRTFPNGNEELLRFTNEELDGFIPIDKDKIYVPAKNDTQHSIIIEGAVFLGKDSPKSINPADKINVVPYKSGMTLLSALVKVGGPTPFARLENCVIQRKNSEQEITVNLDLLWSQRDTTQDIELMPGDYIYVSTDKMVMPIFVAGEVNKPGAIDFFPGLTVGEYILYSGGLDIKSANLNGIYFFDAQGNRTKTSLETVVLPGQNILVDKNPIDKADDYMEKLFIITGWATIIVTLMNEIADFIVAIRE